MDATATIERDTDLDLTDDVIKEAYPTFYGEVVRARSYPPKEGSDRKRLVMEVMPYDIEISSDRGTVTGTYFYTPGDLKKSFTDIHKLTKGLKDQGVSNGHPQIAADVAHCGWFRVVPGRNGFQGNLFPVAKPKDATVPPPPTDWDRDSWLDRFGDDAREATQAAGGLVVESLHADLVEMSLGQRQGSPRIIQAALKDARFGEYDPPTINRTVAALLEQGQLTIADGKYARP